MKHALKNLWKNNKVLVLAFLAACIVMAFFAVQMVSHWIYWNDPARIDQDIAAWMTLRYVMQSWNVPPNVVGEVLGLGPDNRPPPNTTLKMLADQQDVPIATLIENLTKAVTEFKVAPHD